MIIAAQQAAKKFEAFSDPDWDQLVGTTQPTTSTVTSLAQITNNVNVVSNINNLLWEIPQGVSGGTHAYFQAHQTQFKKTVLFSHGGYDYIAANRCSSITTLQDKYLDGSNNGGAFGNGSMSLSQFDLKSESDGLWPGDGISPGGFQAATGLGHASVIEYSRITGPTFLSFGGWPAAAGNIPITTVGPAGTTGEPPTTAQMQNVVQASPGAVYAAGQLVCGTTGIFSLYQVSVGGTCGSDIASWPANGPYLYQNTFTLSNVFADGPDTLQLCPIGSLFHCDAIQSGRAQCIDIRYNRITGYPNSSGFFQSSAQAYDAYNSVSTSAGSPVVTGTSFQPSLAGQWCFITGVAGYFIVSAVLSSTQLQMSTAIPTTVSGATLTIGAPTGSIRVQHCHIQPSGGCRWLYVDSLYQDPYYLNNVMGGRYMRNPTGPVWMPFVGNTLGPAPTPYNGRPEFVTITDNVFYDTAPYSSTNPFLGSLVLAPSFTLPISATNFPPVDAADVYGKIGSGAMNGSGAACAGGDWAVWVPDEATRQAGIKAQYQSDGITPIFSVFEQRFQYGIFPGACNAENWIVFARNRDQRGNTLYPTQRYSCAGFDSHGYYIGV
jgi:hypothetical protein